MTLTFWKATGSETTAARHLCCYTRVFLFCRIQTSQCATWCPAPCPGAKTSISAEPEGEELFPPHHHRRQIGTLSSSAVHHNRSRRPCDTKRNKTTMLCSARVVWCATSSNVITTKQNEAVTKSPTMWTGDSCHSVRWTEYRTATSAIKNDARNTSTSR